MIEEIEHTADAGIRVKAESLEELFYDAAKGMLELIIEDDGSSPDKEIKIKLKANSIEKLLIKFLSEILFHVQDEYNNPRKLKINRIKKNRIEATLMVNNNNAQTGEIKNVTYHNFKLEKVDSGWICEIIFDL
ncbi:MAG: archease [Candidatus Zixiibacteriota bacterium]